MIYPVFSSAPLLTKRIEENDPGMTNPCLNEHIFPALSVGTSLYRSFTVLIRNVPRPVSRYETLLQVIMVVVFSVAKSSICFVEFITHESLQARLIEGIGDSIR